MSTKINRIAVFTSGGDAPGMNAAIRAVVRTAAFHDLHVYGIYNGYEGMIDGEFELLERRNVGNIIHRGGTLLKTARSQRFMTPEGRASAYESLKAYDIDACIALGGNGTFTGAQVFSQEFDIPMIGVPCTIDNDLFGTDFTIGYDSAVNTAIQAVDKIRDTAESHNRLFFIEVMGRNSGYIALATAIGSGAGFVLVPERNGSLEDLIQRLRLNAKRKKLFSLVIVAEGNKLGPASEIARRVKEELTIYDVRVAMLGHLQRGGAPSSFDRMLASRLGYAAVEGLLAGRRNEMVGLVNDEICFTPFEAAISREKQPKDELFRLAEVLAI